MGTAVGIVIFIVLIAIGIAYSSWLSRGVRPRRFYTTLPADRVRMLFVDRVARTGWTIVDDGNPMIAQSPLLTGVRQQLGLQIRTEGNRVLVDVRPMRMQVKVIGKTPTKGHTLRIRMNSFMAAVRMEDPRLQVAA